MVVIRQRIDERPQAVGKTLNIFEGSQYYYRYNAYVTNMNLSAADIWRLYRQRAGSENRIKELKEDFGFESFNLKEFYVTEACLTLVMLA